MRCGRGRECDSGDNDLQGCSSRQAEGSLAWVAVRFTLRKTSLPLQSSSTNLVGVCGPSERVLGPRQLPLHRRLGGLAACGVGQRMWRCDGEAKSEPAPVGASNSTSGIPAEHSHARAAQRSAAQRSNPPAAISSAACRCSSAAASCWPMASYSSSSRWGSCSSVLGLNRQRVHVCAGGWTPIRGVFHSNTPAQRMAQHLRDNAVTRDFHGGNALACWR